jgi:hypothetical protein
MVAAVELRYRPVNQAADYRCVAMDDAGGRYHATIPAADADTPYPLQYFFALRATDGRAWLYPGLAAKLDNQPYLVVRQVPSADR